MIIRGQIMAKWVVSFQVEVTFGYYWPEAEMKLSRLFCITSQWWHGVDLWLSTLPQAINAGQAQVVGGCGWESSVQPAGREKWLGEGEEVLKQNFAR